jgi:hypothetical protein
MLMVKYANLALAFFIELAALGILGYWGFQTGHGMMTKILLGIGSPLLLAVVWGIFLCPKATVPLSSTLSIIIKLAIFTLVAYALYTTQHSTLAYTFISIVVINFILAIIWRQ